MARLTPITPIETYAPQFVPAVSPHDAFVLPFRPWEIITLTVV